MKIRQKKVNKTLDSISETVNSFGLTQEELVVLLSALLIKCGASLHFPAETPIPELDDEVIQKLFLEEQTVPTVLMQVGVDIRKNLLS